MKRRLTMQVIEFSDWMFPAIILSGYLSPLILVLSVLWEVLTKWL